MSPKAESHTLRCHPLSLYCLGCVVQSPAHIRHGPGGREWCSQGDVAVLSSPRVHAARWEVWPGRGSWERVASWEEEESLGGQGVEESRWQSSGQER